MSSMSSGYNFFAFVSTSSRTPTLPKSCSNPAYRNSRSCSRLNRTPRYGPSPARSTASARPTVSVATRKECPAGVRGAAGETRVLEGNGTRGHRRRGQGVVLRKLEPQNAVGRAVLSALDQVQGAGVADRDATRLAENHLEQRQQVALGG